MITVLPYFNFVLSVIPVLNLTINGSYYDADIQEGDDLYLECSIQANPFIHDINWHFEEKLLTENIASGIFINSQTLTLKQTKREHSGKYHCSAENSMDRGRSNSIEVLVKCKLQLNLILDIDIP